MTIRREMAEWRATRTMRDERERRDGETDDGSRSEVRGFQNFEPRTASRAFPASLSRLA